MEYPVGTYEGGLVDGWILNPNSLSQVANSQDAKYADTKRNLESNPIFV